MITKRALFWYYFYCLAGGMMVLPLDLTFAITLNGGIGNPTTIKVAMGTIFTLLLVAPIWRFPNFSRSGVFEPLSLLAILIALLAGHLVLGDLVFTAAMAIYPRGITMMWLGPILLVLLLPLIVALEVKTKRTFQRIPNRIR